MRFVTFVRVAFIYDLELYAPVVSAKIRLRGIQLHTHGHNSCTPHQQVAHSSFLSITLFAQMSLDMIPVMRIGQSLKGRFGTYNLTEKLHKDVWTAL